MRPEKWEAIKSAVADLDHESSLVHEHLDETTNPPGPGEREVLIFKGPLGKMKLEYLSRPVLLDKKTIGSKRIGSAPHVEYIYSTNEFTHKLSACKFDETRADWIEIEAGENFNF